MIENSQYVKFAYAIGDSPSEFCTRRNPLLQIRGYNRSIEAREFYRCNGRPVCSFSRIVNIVENEIEYNGQFDMLRISQPRKEIEEHGFYIKTSAKGCKQLRCSHGGRIAINFEEGEE